MPSFAELAATRINRKAEIKRLNGLLDDEKSALDRLDAAFIERFDEDEGVQWANNEFTFSVGEAIVPNAEDWEQIHAYITENNALHLLQNRLSVTAYRELLGQGVEIPGTVPFTKRSILQRKR
jgi:hypothetical protein